MRQKPGTNQSHGEKVVKDIRRATRRQYSAAGETRNFTRMRRAGFGAMSCEGVALPNPTACP